MAKIIRFDPGLRSGGRRNPAPVCEHRHVIAYTALRVVCCETCGAELDPFDVMVELLKGSIPPGEGNRELKRFFRELKRRDNDKRTKS